LLLPNLSGAAFFISRLFLSPVLTSVKTISYADSFSQYVGNPSAGP